MATSRGPVIYASLVVAAFVAAWVTLLSFERFGETDVRAWAPFLQAILSGGAIFSAFLLQQQKRATDRKDAIADNVEAIVTLGEKAEDTLARLIALAHHGTSISTLQYYRPLISEPLDLLKKQNIALLPTPRAVRMHIGVMHKITAAVAVIDELQRAHRGIHKLEASALERAYDMIHEDRTILLMEIKKEPLKERPPRPTEQLLGWMLGNIVEPDLFSTKIADPESNNYQPNNVQP